VSFRWRLSSDWGGNPRWIILSKSVDDDGTNNGTTRTFPNTTYLLRVCQRHYSSCLYAVLWIWDVKDDWVSLFLSTAHNNIRNKKAIRKPSSTTTPNTHTHTHARASTSQCNYDIKSNHGETLLKLRKIAYLHPRRKLFACVREWLREGGWRISDQVLQRVDSSRPSKGSAGIRISHSILTSLEIS